MLGQNAKWKDRISRRWAERRTHDPIILFQLIPVNQEKVNQAFQSTCA